MKMFSRTQRGFAVRGAIVAAFAIVLFALGPVSIAGADPDTTPPVVTITGYPADNDTAGTFVFSADEPVQGYECQLDGDPLLDPWVACVTPTFVLGLNQGPHEFRVRATDLALNVSDPPALYSWVVDTVTPAIPVIQVPTSGTWTNDSQPTISGTAEPLVEVRVFDGTVLLGSTNADGSGEWSFTPSTPLIDASYSIRVRARDAATNQSGYSVARTLYVDTVAPAAPTITDPNEGELSNAVDLSFAGATEPYASVAVSVDAQTPDSVTATSAGQWSFDPSNAPADGAHSVTATATDRAGNIGPASAAVNFELESVPPPQPVILTPVTGTAQADDSVTFTGTAENQTSVTLFDGSTELASTSADSLGDWDVTFNLADDEYTVVAVATDEYGNESVPSSAVALTIDTTGPTTTILSHPPAFNNQADADFDFEANEPGVDFECSFDMTYWEPCTPIASFTGLPAGLNSFAVRGTDALGNIGAPSDAYEWTIDLVAPAAPTILTPTSPALTNDVREPLTGIAEPYATVEIFIDSPSQTGLLGTATADAGTGEWTFAPSADLPQGDSTLTAIATDRAGNTGLASAALALAVDSVAPTTTIDPGLPIDVARTRSISFSANEANTSFICSLDGAPFASCTSPFVAEGLRYGGHTFAVRATDAAGNGELAAKSLSWQVAMVEAPIGLDPKCSFDRIQPDVEVTVSRLRVGAVRRGRQLITFRADQPGIGRVALVRRGRELRHVVLAVKRGKNAVRMKAKPQLAAQATADLLISTVSTTARRSVRGVPVVIDPEGAVLPLELEARQKAVKCAKPKGARAAALKILSVRRAGNLLVIRMRSNQLVLATFRVNDGFAAAQAPVTRFAARRTGELSVELPPGLGDRPTTTSIEITAFDTEYARSKASAAFPTG